ncbi:MAG: pitrilysin family protein [Rhodospirillaceae bacterium]
MPISLDSRRIILALALVIAAVAGEAVVNEAVAGEATTSKPASSTSPVTHGVYFPETFTIANGLQVVVVTNRRVPVVSHMLWYKVGGADARPGKSGIAHFLEHLMFKGTPSVSSGEFSKIVARNGGRDNAFTSDDFTVYFQNVALSRLKLVMGMEADRMVNLTLSDANVYPERDVVLEERRQNVGNHPSARLYEQVDAALYINHPYGIPVLGWEHEIRSLTREDAESFYRSWYAPNNAILVVTGDIDASELRPLVDQTYGLIPARPVPAHALTEIPQQDAEIRVVLRDAQVREPQVFREVIAPSFRHGEVKHAYPLVVLAEIMSGGPTSRLNKALVVDQRLATSAWLSYSPLKNGPTTLTIGATPVPGGDIARSEASLDAEIHKLLKDGVSDEEVATARKRLLASAAYARDSLQGPAYAIGMELVTGHSLDEVESWPERIGEVTATQVNEAARAILGRNGGVVSLLLPKDDKTKDDKKADENPMIKNQGRNE